MSRACGGCKPFLLYGSQPESGQETLGCCSNSVEETSMSDDSTALIAQLREALTQQRYNLVAIGNYCRSADYFLRHLAARGIALEA
jgi:hypothetical protein